MLCLSRSGDPQQAYYAQEAREFLRKKLIGKQVQVTTNFTRPAEGDFEERECATIRFGNRDVSVPPPSTFGYTLITETCVYSRNIAEQIIEKGLATAVRHKRDDENRSPDYDKLMAAEQT